MATKMMTLGEVMKTAACYRCKRRMPKALKRSGGGNWNMQFAKGVLVGFLCPECQTPEENAEAEVKAATLDYGRDAFGRLVAHPKGVF